MKKILIIIVLAVIAYFGINYINSTPEQVVIQEVVSESDIEVSEAPEDAFQVAEASTLAWVGTKPLGSHDGTVDLESGYLTADYEGVFIIDMTTLYTPDGDGIGKHLKSKDFFDVEVHPQAFFIVDGYDDNMLSGELTIHGVTQEVEIPAEVSIIEDTMSIVASYEFDRTDYNITYKSGSVFENLGDALINDTVSLSIDLIAQR